MSNDRALMTVFCHACEKCKSISQWNIKDWEKIRDWERQCVSSITQVVNCLSADQMTIFSQASSLKEGLEKLNLSFRFDRQVLEKVDLSQDNDWARTALKLIIFFQAVGFITSDNTDIDLDGAADLFRCWFEIGPIGKDLDGIFASIMTSILAEKKPLRANLLRYLTKWYSTTVTNSEKFEKFMDLVKMCFTSDDKSLIAVALERAVILVSDQGIVFTKDMWRRLIDCSEDFALTFDPNALKLWASVSTKWLTSECYMESQFRRLGQQVIALVNTSDEQFSKNACEIPTCPAVENLDSFIEPRCDESQYDCCVRFSAGPSLETILDENVIVSLDSVVELLNNSRNAHCKELLSEIERIIVENHYEERVCVQVSCGYILAKLTSDSKIVEFFKDRDLIVSKNVFDPKETACLEGTLDDRKSMLRGIIFQRLNNSSSTAKLLQVILKNDHTNFFLFIEHLGRLLNMKDVKLADILDTELVGYVLDNARLSQGLDSKYFDVMATAIQFLLKIVETDYFYHHCFFPRFTQFLFDKGLCRILLTKIEERCCQLTCSQSVHVVNQFVLLLKDCRANITTNDYLSLAHSIVSLSLSVMKKNPAVIDRFSDLFVQILECVLANRTPDFVKLLLDFVVVSNVTSFDSFNIQRLVPVVCDCMDDKDVFPKLISLMTTSSSTKLNGGLFFIDRPGAVLFIAACAYHRPEFFNQIFTLCGSYYNIRVLHECGFDYLLLFLLTCTPGQRFLFHGFNFCANLSEDTQNVISDTLLRILLIVSGNGIVEILIERAAANNKFARRLLETVTMRSLVEPKQITILGRSEPSMLGTKKLPQTKNTSEFMLAMFIKQDVTGTGAGSQEILRITNQQRDELRMTSITETTGVRLYIQINDGAPIEVFLAHETWPPDVWYPCCIGFYSKYIAVYFHHKLAVTSGNVKLGNEITLFSGCSYVSDGNRGTRECGFIGDLMVAPLTVSTDNFADFAKSYLVSGPSDTVQFDRKLLTRNFAHLDVCLEKYLPQIQDIDFLYLFIQLAKIQGSCVMLKASDILSMPLMQGRLNSDLYFVIVALFDKIGDQSGELFKCVITNWELWSKADDQSKVDIITHWCEFVPTNYRKYIDGDYFTSMLIQFNGDLDDRTMNLFSLFMRRLAYVHFQECDQRALLEFACSEESPKWCEIYLTIIQAVAWRIQPEIAQEYSQKLLNLLSRSYNDSNIAALCVTCLAQPVFGVETMILIQFFDDLTETALRLLCDTLIANSFDSSSFFVLCYLVWAFDCLSNYRKAVVGLYCNVWNNGREISKSPFWYVWPLLFACLLEDPQQSRLVSLVGRLAQTCESSEIRKIVALIHILNDNGAALSISAFLSVDRTIGREAARTFVELCAEHFFFHPSDERYNPEILEIMQETYGSVSDVLPPHTEKQRISGMNGLEAALKNKKSDTLTYRIRVDKDMNIIDADYLRIFGLLEGKLKIEDIGQAEMIKKLKEILPKKEDYKPSPIAADSFTSEWEAAVARARELKAALPSYKPDSSSRAPFFAKRKLVLPSESHSQRKEVDLVVSPLLCNGHPAKLMRRKHSSGQAQPITKNCVLWRITADGPISSDCMVTFRDTTPAMLILKTPTSEERILKSSIDYVIRVEESHYQMYTSDGSSFVFMSMTSKLSKLFKEMQSNPPLKWKSTFRFLLECNKRVGRTFNLPSQYPMFPALLGSIKDPYTIGTLSSIASESDSNVILCNGETDLETALTGVQAIAPEFFCFPELITQELPPWATSSYDVVYALRQMLERRQCAKSLVPWVECHLCKGKGLLKLPQREYVNVTEGTREISIPYTLRSAIRCGKYVAVVSEVNNGTVVEITGGLLKSDTGIKWERVRKDGKGVPCYVDKNTVVIYDPDTSGLIQVGLKPSETVVTCNGIVGFFQGALVYCPSPCAIKLRKRLRRTVSPVSALAVNDTYRSLVFAMADGMVCFSSLPEFEDLSVVMLSGLVTKILITEAWGFVVLLCGTEICVYNVNGTFVKTAEFSRLVKCWSSFTSAYDFDYVVYADGDDNVWYFEVFYPDMHTKIGTFPGVLSVHYDNDSSSFVMIQAEGKITQVVTCIPLSERPSKTCVLARGSSE